MVAPLELCKNVYNYLSTLLPPSLLETGFDKGNGIGTSAMAPLCLKYYSIIRNSLFAGSLFGGVFPGTGDIIL
jgi:hypothetical protein